MPECVSCGKDIPAGKFFCDDCYVKMKGRRGALKEVSKAPAAEGGMPDGATADEVTETTTEAPPDETLAAKKASGTLTPTSGKKVVSIKPDVDKSSRERGRGGKKKFTVTITFSERTYAALDRLKRKSKSEAGVPGEDEGVTPMQPEKHKKRRKGPYGRPQLKAVTTAPGREGASKRGLAGWISYRDRAWDRQDKAAIGTATISLIVILALSFTNWVKLSWTVGEAGQGQAVDIKGVDLGVLFYVAIAILVIAYLYMVATWVFKGIFTKVDYGVLLIVAGLAFIPLIYANIASTERLFEAAYRILGLGSGVVPENYQRSTLFPAYIVVLMGAAFAISGLVRLSERRVETTQGA
jgi:hypothetical protein